MKNVVSEQGALTGSAQNTLLAKAVNDPAPGTVQTDCSQGCTIKALYLTMDFCGTAGTGVANNLQAYLFKNPGNNLTGPSPGSTGTSNEKKFIIREWSAMIMRNQDGNAPVHFEGWVKIPKIYQRMGLDDVWQLVFSCTAAVTGLYSIRCIYKYYS